MAKRLFAFFDTLFDITVALIAIPQFLFFVPLYFMRETYDGSRLANLPAYVCIAALLLSSYSFIRITVTYNGSLRENFWEKNVDSSLKSSLMFLVSQPEFWIKAFIIALLYVLAPLDWTLKALAVLTNTNTFVDKLLWLAILLPILFVVAVLGHISAYKQWRENKNPANYSKKEANQETVFASIAYGGGACAIIFAVPILSPIIMLVYRSLTVGHVIAIAILLCLPFVYRFFNAIFKRMSFLRRLKKICAEKGYTLSKIQYPYLSLFMFLKDESFNITVGEKVYSCKLISARKRKSPIVISQGGELAFIHTISMRGIVLHQRAKAYKFAYESENPKIIIINPVPRLVCDQKGDKVAQIDNGAVVGGYKIFAASGFLRAAELDVLDR